MKTKACIVILIAMFAISAGLAGSAWAQENNVDKQIKSASAPELIVVANGVGWCDCEDIDEKCRISRNKCKKGFKPKCIDLGKGECACECVQK